MIRNNPGNARVCPGLQAPMVHTESGDMFLREAVTYC